LLIGVVAGVAAKLFVMDFQVRHRAGGLAPPAVAEQNLLAQIFIGDGNKPPAKGTLGVFNSASSANNTALAPLSEPTLASLLGSSLVFMLEFP
jgi:hypothetical protein